MSARSLPVDLYQLTPGEFNQAYGTSLTNSDFYRMRAGVARRSRILILETDLAGDDQWVDERADAAVVTGIYLIFEGGSGPSTLNITDSANREEISQALVLNNSFQLTGIEEVGLHVSVDSADRTGYLLILGYTPGDLPS